LRLVYHQAASDNLPLAWDLLLNHQITTTCGARIDALNGKILKMIWFHANLIDIPYAHEEAGSESWFTSLIILISKFIHHLLIRLSAVNIE
jgi:hypothetical protein